MRPVFDVLLEEARRSHFGSFGIERIDRIG